MEYCLRWHQSIFPRYVDIIQGGECVLWEKPGGNILDHGGQLLGAIIYVPLYNVSSTRIMMYTNYINFMHCYVASE